MSTHRMVIEQPERPPSLEQALDLVESLLAIAKTMTTPYGWMHRRALVREAEAALDAARRFGIHKEAR